MYRIAIIFICSLVLFPAFSGAKTGCESGKHWVSAHYRKAYTKYDGASVRATQVKGHCRKNPRGYEKWHQNLSNNRPKIWGYKKEKSKKWRGEEIERILDAISVLPDKLINFKNVKIHRMESSKFPKNPATSNGNDITLYDEAFVHENSLAQIMSHELSHVVYRQLKKSDKDEFNQEAKWVKKEDESGNTYYTTRGEKVFIQLDSRDSMSEDFANHIEHFLFKNNSLKRNSKAAYFWIQKKFGKDFAIQGDKK